MDFQEKNITNSIMLKLAALGLVLCLHGIVASERVYAQTALPPIEKEGFLKALHEHVLLINELKRDLSARGVSFRLTVDIENEIRREGQYLGKTGVDQLIEAVRKNFRPHERLRVSLFKYVPCDEHYDQFARLLNSKVYAISSKLIEKDERSSYTAGLKLVKEEKSAVMSLLEANQYWEKTQSLQLLQGICSLKGQEVYVISQVFLGDLSGPLGKTIRIEFKVDSDEFATTRDIHSLLILYSLAKDAQARGLSKDLIIAYLAEAIGIAGQIKHAQAAGLPRIKSAVELMLRELGASDLAVIPTQ
jgi:hypothetical protein